MKKLFAILIIGVILLSQASFVLAVAQGQQCNCSDADCTNSDCDPGLKCFCDPDGTGPAKGVCQPAGATVLCPPTKYRTISELIESIINWVFYIGIIIAPLMILVGALYFMTAAGVPQRVETGKKIIFWTIVGLVIILFSKGIISIVKAILGG